MKTRGYSLWLVPTGEVKKFTSLINRLASKYNAPLFEPHVTLLGEIILPGEEVIELAGQLVNGQKPFPISLTNVDYQDFYFRTLFVKANKTEPLQTLHNRAKEIFDMENILDYMPHLSLMYGNFPKELKEKIIKDIGRDQSVEFIVYSINIIKTDGEVNKWYKIKEIPFYDIGIASAKQNVRFSDSKICHFDLRSLY